MKRFVAILMGMMTTIASQAQTTDRQQLTNEARTEGKLACTMLCKEEEDESQIEQLYREMYQAMVEKDSATLDRVHADEFVLVHMTGMRQSKREYIRAIMDGTLNYYSATHEQMDIVLDGDRATLTGRSRVTAAVFGGGRGTWRLQLRFQLVKRDGRWQFTEARASTY